MSKLQSYCSLGKTDLLTKFISKKGRPFSAYLAADDSGKTRFEFEEKRAKVGSKVKTINPKIKKPATKKPATKKPATKKSAKEASRHQN